MKNFSERYQATIYFKREDLQVVRSYKIRGAYNKIQGLNESQLQNGIVCASAGNHAQGVAFACKSLLVHGTIFMPVTTPHQKIDQVKMFGGKFIEIKLFGDSFDDSQKAAKEFCDENKSIFVHPFDDLEVIAGQGTVGLEILNDISVSIDYLFLPVGGGGLASGVGSVFKALSPATKIIGVEPKGAPSLTTSLEKGENTTLEEIEKFVDGAAVKRMGDITFEFCKEFLHSVDLIDEGLICSTILKVYNENAMVVEPAGALSIAALESAFGKASEGASVNHSGSFAASAYPFMVARGFSPNSSAFSLLMSTTAAAPSSSHRQMRPTHERIHDTQA